MNKKFQRPKDHNCEISTTISEAISFGKGELDEWGFWEHGCYECARAWEKQFPESGECWPHSRKTLMLNKIQRFVKKYGLKSILVV